MVHGDWFMFLGFMFAVVGMITASRVLIGVGVILLLLGSVVHFAHADEAPPDGPRKIVGSIVRPGETDPKKRIIEQFKYPVPFENEAACQHERASENFKRAMADLQSKATRLGALGKDFQGLGVEAACAPIDDKPVHP